MSIGKWIVVVFILFAVFIGTLVTICVRQDISLVSKEYYKEELVYQDQIGRLNNTAALERKPQVVVTPAFIRVTFDSTQAITQGELKLFCPSDETMDRTFKLSGNATSFTGPISNMKPGMYRIKLSWSMNNKEYYQEEIVNL